MTFEESMAIRARADYQRFEFDADGNPCNPNVRLVRKMQAIPLPELKGKRVLDLGCDMGFWSFLASAMGASEVLGIDRNRKMKGQKVDLIELNDATVLHFPKRYLGKCYFQEMDLGKQWHDLRTESCPGFDVIFCFSMFHHVFENTGGNMEPIWFWLWQQLKADGALIWEGPMDAKDRTVMLDVDSQWRAGYTQTMILHTANRYFTHEYVGPALHEATRHVWRFWPHPGKICSAQALLRSGAGGATKAFQYEGGRRIREIRDILGWDMVYPGSLNCELTAAFPWQTGYYRASLMDVVDRRAGLESAWEYYKARFYPVRLNGVNAVAFRFERDQERYPLNFVELIAPYCLRDRIGTGRCVLEKCST